MCLAVPGQIIELIDESSLLPQARVAFGGIVKQVCLAYTPEARNGDYVLVHAGFALSVVNEVEAQRVFDTLDEALAGETK